MARELLQVRGACAPISYIVLGPIETNVYLIEDGAGGIIVVDPEYSAETIISGAGEKPISAIFVTHRHHDHIGALRALKQKTGAAVYASAIDTPGIEDPKPAQTSGRLVAGCSVDVLLEDGEKLQVGKTTWEFMATPGHTPGSGCFYLRPEQSINRQAAPVLVSGDTLFCGSIGRTDFEGGSMAQMAASMRKLASLPDETIVLPGHNETTTIRAERIRTIEYFGKM